MDFDNTNWYGVLAKKKECKKNHENNYTDTTLSVGTAFK